MADQPPLGPEVDWTPAQRPTRATLVVKGRSRDTAWYAIADERWPAIRSGFRAWLSPENFDGGGLQKRSLRSLIHEARG